MKPPGMKRKYPHSLPLTALLLGTLFILAALVTILALIVRDIYTAEPVSARLNGEGHLSTSPPVVPTATAADGRIAVPTPFPPAPTNTTAPTPAPSPTWTEIPPPPVVIPPDPSYPPDTATISDIVGFEQSLTLDCESRSAVDWAAYFGVNISEFEFVDALPRSDDPNKGFVGDPNGYPQQLPPYSYGVHAAPVARLLRSYGLPAEDLYGLDMDTLKAEIAAGQPVIVWVTVYTRRGYAVDYVTSDGETVRVAPNEHTVIIIGYDPEGVMVLDGSEVYHRSWGLFQDSFGVLGNMAIVYSK